MRGVNTVVFNKGSSSIASGSSDGTVNVLDASTFATILWRFLALPDRHACVDTSSCNSANPHRAVFAAGDQYLRVHVLELGIREENDVGSINCAC
jgi:WD40 repeat protein